jgi:transcriptional regulator with GAF, ATPase, and Fis domain
MKLNRENLLEVYCLFRHLNGKDKPTIYRQLLEIFGARFIEDWEKLFLETAPLNQFDQDHKQICRLPTLRLIDLEYMAIMIALEKKCFVQKYAAKELGISPRSLNYKISYHEITHESWQKNVEESNE